MVYTPDDQLLEPHLKTIIEGIDGLIKAVNERIDDNKEWKREHLIEITDLSSRLQTLRTELVLLKDNTR